MKPQIPGMATSPSSSPVELSEKDDATPISPKVESSADLENLPQENQYSAFPPLSRRCIIALCALSGFLSPFSAFTYFPALDYMAKDLDVSLQLLDLTITMFLVVQGIIPALLGDVADQVGRRPVYMLVLAVYAVACVVLAVQNSYAALMVGRMLQSAGSSATIALGVMVVADLAPPHSRGKYVGAMLSGPNCGPSLGPIVGGLLTELAGWRWIFVMLAVLGGACLIPMTLVFPETCRYSVGNGIYKAGRLNEPLFPFLVPKGRQPPPAGSDLSHRFRKIPNPFKCLRILASRHDSLLLTSNALFYVSYSCIHASLAPLTMKIYNLNALEAGLCYLSYGIATISSSYAVGKVLNWDYKMTAKHEGLVINTVEGDKLEEFPVERARIRSLGVWVIGAACATIGFGWALETRVHLSCALVMTTICGVCFTGVFNTCLTLNVDLHPHETGLASVAASLTRCLAAAVGIAVMQPLLDSIGAGWTFTVFGLLSMLSVPMLLALRVWGPGWRGCDYKSRRTTDAAEH